MAKTTKKSRKAAPAKKNARAAKGAPKKAARARANAVKGKKAARKAAPARNKESNRRRHRRINTPNMWVTEFRGEYRYVVQASNLSEGGIFLQGRLKPLSREASRLRIHSGNGEVLEVAARPVHDVIGASNYGAGYQFVDVSPAQSRALRGLLRDLD